MRSTTPESTPARSRLRPEYEALARAGDWRAYVAALCADGVRWFLEIDQPQVAFHLAPLAGVAELHEPPRLQVLRLACSPAADLGRLDELRQVLVESGDAEGALGAVCAALLAIWNTGAGFERQGALGAELVGLLARGGPGLSPLARAGGHCFLGMGLLLGVGDLEASAAQFGEAARLAGEAGSPSLQVYAATGLGYRLFFAGDLSRLEVLFFDTLPLASRPEVAEPSRRQIDMLRGLALSYSGRPEEALEVLDGSVPRLPAPEVPLSHWLLGNCHRLLAVGLLGDPAAVDELVTALQAHVVPTRATFFQSHVHAAMSASDLAAGRPASALAHAEEAERTGQLGGSAHSPRVAVYLEGRALADLGRHEEAAARLGGWVDRWIASGYTLFAASALVELASLDLAAGRSESAREHLDRASAVLPAGARPVPLFRPAFFGRRLALALEPSRSAWAGGDRPVQIETFGTLRLRYRGRSLLAKEWPGVRTRALLEAVLAGGGVDVPADLIVDQLWPESEGDRGLNALKVTLSRLRRIGLGPDDTPTPWIASRGGAIWLDPEHCSVDFLAFDEEVRSALSDPSEVDRLAWALRIYTGDFLARDRETPWVAERRGRLRDLLAEGATALAERALAAGRAAEHLPLLERAHATVPESERLCCGLMAAYLEAGFPSEALRAFDRTGAAIERALGCSPGPRLLESAARARAAATAL